MLKVENKRVYYTLVICSLCLLFVSIAPYGVNLTLFFDIFSHFRWHLFVVAAIFVFGAIIIRGRLLFCMSLIALVINTEPLSFQLQGKKANIFKPAINVAAINVLWTRTNCRAVTKYIQSLSADIVGVIEVTPECRKDLNLLKKEYPYMWFAEPSTQVATVKLHGLGILSRRAWSSVDQLQSPLIPRRYAIQASFDTLSGPLAVFITPLVRPVPPAPGDWGRSQGAEVKNLIDQVTRFKGESIVMGDLNTSPYSAVFRKFGRAGLSPAAGTGLPTWPISLGPLGLSIDHILVTHNLKAVMTTGADVGSDHLPILGAVNWKVREGF